MCPRSIDWPSTGWLAGSEQARSSTFGRRPPGMVGGMHYDQQGCIEVRRQTGAQLLQGFDSARRSTDYNQVPIRHPPLGTLR